MRPAQWAFSFSAGPLRCEPCHGVLRQSSLWGQVACEGCAEKGQWGACETYQCGLRWSSQWYDEARGGVGSLAVVAASAQEGPSSAGPAFPEGPAAQIRRSGADTRRAARSSTMSADSSTTRGREIENRNSQGRDRWLARQPHPEVARAVRTGEWQPCMNWAKGKLLFELGKSSLVADLRLDVLDQSARMDMWLHFEVNCPWDLRHSQVIARAYMRTLRVQKASGSRFAQKAIGAVLRHMRDVVIVGAIIQAGCHDDPEQITTALGIMFEGGVDTDINAQMQHCYHQLLHGAAHAYMSNCKRGRLRKARVRPGAEGATDGETEADEADESDVAESSESAPHGSSESAWHRRVVHEMKNEGAQLWRALREQEARVQRAEDRAQRAEDARLQLQLEVLTLREDMEVYKAKVAHLEAQQVKQGQSVPCPLSTQGLCPAMAESEKWLKQNPAPFENSQVVDIPILKLRWDGWCPDYTKNAMTSQPCQPEEMSVQQCVRGPIASHELLTESHEPLTVLQHTTFFWVLAPDVEEIARLAALTRLQGLHRNRMVVTPCKVCCGNGSSSSAAPAHFQGFSMAATAMSDEELLGTDLCRHVSDEEKENRV